MSVREAFKKNTSYLVTLSKRGGRGQNKITILGVLEIMTSLEGRGGYRINVTISMTPLGGIFRAKINLIIQYLVLKMTENCEESSAIKTNYFFCTLP